MVSGCWFWLWTDLQIRSCSLLRSSMFHCYPSLHLQQPTYWQLTASCSVFNCQCWLCVIFILVCAQSSCIRWYFEYHFSLNLSILFTFFKSDLQIVDWCFYIAVYSSCFLSLLLLLCCHPAAAAFAPSVKGHNKLTVHTVAFVATTAQGQL